MGFVWSALRRGDMIQKRHIDELRANLDVVDNTKCVSNYATYNYAEHTFAYFDDYLSDDGSAEVTYHNGYNSGDDTSYNVTVYSGDDGGYNSAEDNPYDVSVNDLEKASNLLSNDASVYSNNDDYDYAQVNTSERVAYDVENYVDDKIDNSSYYADDDSSDNLTYCGTEDATADIGEHSAYCGADYLTYYGTVDKDDNGTYYSDEHGTYNLGYDSTVYSGENGTYFNDEHGTYNLGYDSAVYSGEDGTYYYNEHGTYNLGYDSTVYSGENGVYNYNEHGTYNYNEHGTYKSSYDSTVYSILL